MTVSLSLIVIAPLGAELISLEEMTGRWKDHARAAASKRKWTEAAGLLRKVELANGKDAESQHLYAFVLYQAKQYSAAAQKYHEVLLQDEKSFAAAYHLGQCLFEMKFHALAATAFERAATLKLKGEELWNPKVDGKPLNVANATAMAEIEKVRCLIEWGEALGKLRKVKFPEKVKKVLDDTEDALGILSMAPLADGLKGRVDYFSALLSLQKGETGVAGKKFLNFVSSMPEHPLAPTALFEEARSWEEENPQMARRRYQAVITQYKRSEKVADAMVRIGVLYSKEKKHELAATALLKYLEMFPNSEIAPKVHYKIAQSYFHAAKAKGSDELYQLAADKFIDLTKREGVASSLRIPSFYFAGESLLGCNRMGAARASFEKLILDWPESGWVKLARDRLNSKALKKPK